MTTKNIGSEGFKWFFGYVVDTNDTENLGMVKVRVPHIHGNMAAEEIPWATLVMPPHAASLYEVGISPTGIEVGSMVFGFFADGNEHNIPIVIGTINKINENDKSKHDVSKLARGTQSLRKKPFGFEPPSAYKAKYPYNKTYTTKSGHAVEFDDTPGQERIHIYHKTGTYVEMNKDGRMVTKVEGENYEVTMKDKKVTIGGNMDVVINGNVNIKVNGDYNLTARSINLNNGSKGAARVGDPVPDTESDGTQGIGSGSSSVFIGG